MALFQLRLVKERLYMTPVYLIHPTIQRIVTETLLSLTLQLVLDGVISLPEAISRVTFNPACILGIDVGRLSPGAPADVCIFNPSLEQNIDVGDFYSQGRNSPFDGSNLAGQVTAVIVAGKVVNI